MFSWFNQFIVNVVFVILYVPGVLVGFLVSLYHDRKMGSWRNQQPRRS